MRTLRHVCRLGALLVLALGSRPNARETATLLTGAVTFYHVLGLLHLGEDSLDGLARLIDGELGSGGALGAGVSAGAAGAAGGVRATHAGGALHAGLVHGLAALVRLSVLPRHLASGVLSERSVYPPELGFIKN